MEGGRGKQQAMCTPPVILLIMCLLAGVIGWQMGRRHGAAEQAAAAPVCPSAALDGDAGSLAASSGAGDVVRAAHVDLLNALGSMVSVSVAELEAIHQRDMAAHAQVFKERSWRMLEGPWGPIELWEAFGPTYPCIPRERIGDVLDGGKWACGLSSLLATEPCSVFSLGSHGQVDFEAAVRERYPHCRIFVYDHTLNDKQRAAVLAVNVLAYDIILDSDLRSAYSLPDTTIAAQKMAVRIYALTGTELFELGIDSERRLSKSDYAEPDRFTSVPREMKKLGVKWYQILKTDIEGFEWEVFDDFFARGETMPFSQILVELHADRLPRSWGNRTAAFSHFFGEMAKQQYRVANHEVNFRKVDWYQQFKTPVPIPSMAEYTFVKVNSRGQVITGPDLL